MIDRKLAREVRTKANGGGSRKAMLAFNRKVMAAASDMSTPEMMIKGRLEEMCTKHGRATVAICIAATLVHRQAELDRWGCGWAEALLSQWTNRPVNGLENAVIHDGLHPSRICEYARMFIRMASEGYKDET